MSRINLGRVVIGGLVAGVLINLSETALNLWVLAEEMDALEARLGVEVGTGAMVAFMALGFLVGMIATWLYAAMRPRFGAGVGTAVKAGLAVWALAVLYSVVAPAAMGMYPMTVAVICAAWMLVELTLATVVGAWLYREGAAVSASAPAAAAGRF